jgi:hypothetical protein
MKTPEAKVKDSVKTMLKIHGAYYHMPVMNGMGAPTLDFVGCHFGFFFAIETKAPGKAPTPRQLTTIATMEKAGANVFVIDGANGLAQLGFWLKEKIDANK